MASASEQTFKSKLDRAVNGHYYIHVFEKDGKLKTSHIKLSGFRQMFQKDPEFMYVYSLRHAGKYDHLIKYMTEMGFAESDVRTYLQDSYTVANHAAKLGDIEQELANVPVVKKEAKKPISLKEIISLKSQLDTLVMPKKAAAAATADDIAVPTTPKNKSRTDLKSRLDALEEDKVIDITNFDAEKKTGIKTGKRTVKGTRRPLAATGDLHRVVFDFEKNTDIAVAALVFMGMTQDAAKAALSANQTGKTASLAKVAISPRK